ncbi:outer membrane lipoprotein-sorting protein [Algibacillus agarilyticus]|uniref:outer membrane lipoprotein-sorting protein n=1 Tax=Algibacillus agarilyticus TaxID=2234133 RepID=UPI000DD08F24|nr:outer membrane lipoprotein-sorting protein [Algibacillus agarilyticus]
MKIYLFISLFISTLVCSFTLQANTLIDANWIVQQVNSRDEGEAVSRQLTMTMIDRSGKKRVRETQAFRKYFGDEKRTAIFYETPKNIKDTAFLTYDYANKNKDDDQWLYLPAMRRVRRISAADRGDYFLGTDFTYEEIKLETKISVDDYNHRTLKSKYIEGIDYYVIESVPKNSHVAKELGYSKLESYIDKNIWITRKAIYWDTKGNLLKTITFTDIRLIQNIWTAHQIKVVNYKTEHTTEFIFKNVNYDQVISNKIFTQQTLKRGL